VVFRINSKTATLVLSLAMDEEGNVGVSRLEAQSVVYLSAEALAAQHTGTLILVLGIVFAGVAGIVIFFLILFKRRKKDEEEEQPVQA
jgi:heme/copper-type cytochrome/quinol oxidase subunit 2